jgi:hypothetical protein
MIPAEAGINAGTVVHGTTGPMLAARKDAEEKGQCLLESDAGTIKTTRASRTAFKMQLLIVIWVFGGFGILI